MRKLPLFFCLSVLLSMLSACMDAGYRLSFPEIDDLADRYPAQARVFLSRADSNQDKGYYKLLAAKITYKLRGFSFDESNIDDAIRIFAQERNEPQLARALYYKGALLLNNLHDTAQAVAIFGKARAYAVGMRTAEKLQMYDLLCRLTHTNASVVQLDDEARQQGNIPYQAWAMLYLALNNHDLLLAEKAFQKADDIEENKDSVLGPMYHYYFKEMIDRGELPDSTLWHYAMEARKMGASPYYDNLDFYRLLWRTGYVRYAKQYIEQETQFSGYLCRGVFIGWNYDELLPLYFIALHHHDMSTAHHLANNLRLMTPFLANHQDGNKAENVRLMYEGGNARYRYEKTKTLVLVGIIFVLVALLVIAYFYISRMRKARQTISQLHLSLSQLKDVENVSLSKRCEELNHHISLQLLKLKRREKDIEMYREQIAELSNVSQGLVYYSMAVQNQNISQIGKLGIRQLLSSFKMIDEKYAARLDDYDLNPSQCLFCLLYHIGKTDEEVMQILQYSLANVRVRKSRIKADVGEESFESIIK